MSQPTPPPSAIKEALQREADAGTRLGTLLRSLARGMVDTGSTPLAVVLGAHTLLKWAGIGMIRASYALMPIENAREVMGFLALTLEDLRAMFQAEYDRQEQKAADGSSPLPGPMTTKH